MENVNDDQYVFPEMKPALHFEVASVSEVADKLNDLIGQFYKDSRGNIFRSTGFYHFQVLVVDKMIPAIPGTNIQEYTLPKYHVIALPMYEHVEWMSKPLPLGEQIAKDLDFDGPALTGRS